MPTSLPSETPKKNLCHTEGRAPSKCLAKDNEGVADNAGPKVDVYSGVNTTTGGMPSACPVHVSPLASPRLDDLDGLIGQALFNLATTFDFNLPLKGTPAFEFLSLLSSVSTPSGGEFATNIYDAFFMGVVRVMASKAVTPTNGDA